MSVFVINGKHVIPVDIDTLNEHLLSITTIDNYKEIMVMIVHEKPCYTIGSYKFNDDCTKMVNTIDENMTIPTSNINQKIFPKVQIPIVETSEYILMNTDIDKCHKLNLEQLQEKIITIKDLYKCKIIKLSDQSIYNFNKELLQFYCDFNKTCLNLDLSQCIKNYQMVIFYVDNLANPYALPNFYKTTEMKSLNNGCTDLNSYCLSVANEVEQLTDKLTNISSIRIYYDGKVEGSIKSDGLYYGRNKKHDVTEFVTIYQTCANKMIVYKNAVEKFNDLDNDSTKDFVRDNFIEFGKFLSDPNNCIADTQKQIDALELMNHSFYTSFSITK